MRIHTAQSNHLHLSFPLIASFSLLNAPMKSNSSGQRYPLPSLRRDIVLQKIADQVLLLEHKRPDDLGNIIWPSILDLLQDTPRLLAIDIVCLRSDEASRINGIVEHRRGEGNRSQHLCCFDTICPIDRAVANTSPDSDCSCIDGVGSYGTSIYLEGFPG